MGGKTTDASGERRAALLPILVVNFVGTLGFSIVLPFLVYLVTRWGGNALIFGLLGATYSFFQLIGAPVLGRWSDRFGRKPILLLSQIGTLFSWALFLTAFFVPMTTLVDVDSGTLGRFTLTLPLVIALIARAADGLTGGNVSVAIAYLADITDDAHRSADFGKMAISGNLGFVIGPALAGLLAATIYGEVLPVIAALLISLVATAIIAFGLQDTHPCEMARDPERDNVRRVFGQENRSCYELTDKEDITAAQILHLNGVPTLLLIYFLVILGFSFFYIAFPVHAVKGLDWSIAETGMFFTVLSLMMIVVQGPILARASKKISEPVLTFAGSLILAAGFVLLFWNNGVVIYTAAALIALGNGLMWPSVMSLLSKAAGDQHQGAVQGFAGSASAVASIIGLLAGGFLYNWFEEWSFVVSAATILMVAVIARAAVHRSPQLQ